MCVPVLEVLGRFVELQYDFLYMVSFSGWRCVVLVIIPSVFFREARYDLFFFNRTNEEKWRISLKLWRIKFWKAKKWR
jgi:hypothetical protein